MTSDEDIQRQVDEQIFAEIAFAEAQRQREREHDRRAAQQGIAELGQRVARRSSNPELLFTEAARSKETSTSDWYNKLKEAIDKLGGGQSAPIPPLAPLEDPHAHISLFSPRHKPRKMHCATCSSDDHFPEDCAEKSHKQRSKSKSINNPDSSAGRKRAARKLEKKAAAEHGHGLPRNLEEVARLRNAAEELIAESANEGEAESVFQQLACILDDQLVLAQGERTLVELAEAIHMTLEKSKAARVGAGENPIFVGKQLQWADWILEAVRIGLVHEKTEHCNNDCTNNFQFSQFI